MKNLTNLILALLLSVSFFACSKKAQTFRFENQTRQEASKMAAQCVSNSYESGEVHYKSELPDPTFMALTFPHSEKNAPVSIAEKPILKHGFVQKMVQKKIQKMDENHAVSNKMKLGIVIAAISLLVLIIVAAGLLGGLSGLFWLLGGLGLLTGLLIMLLVALDVI